MLQNRNILSFVLATLVMGTTLQAVGIAQTNSKAAPAMITMRPTTRTASVYNWRNVEINGGGFVSGVMFHPRARGLIYARTDIGGAYRWNARSKRWIPLTDGFGSEDWNLYGIESLAPDPTDPNRVYAAIGTYTNDWAGNGAILRSINKGDTWQRTNLPFKNGGNELGRGMGERLIVSPRDPKTLFFGTRRNGLWKSSDYGATWAKVANFPAPENENGYGVSFLQFDAQGTLYAGVASNSANLFQSSDGGASWKSVAGAPQGFFPHHGVFASDGTLYLTYCNGPGPNDVTDGAVWKRSAAGVWTKITPSAGNGFGYAGLSVDARNPRVLMVASLDRWALGDDVWRSTDAGASWMGVKALSTRDASAAPYLAGKDGQADLGHWIASLAIDPFDSGHVLYVTGATIWGSDNANALDTGRISRWNVRAGGIEEVAVSKLVSPPVGPHLVSGMRDIGGFVHEDLTVSPRTGSMSNPRMSRNEGIDFAEKSPTFIARSGDNKGAYSLDSGKTWTEFASHPPENMDQGAIAVGAEGASLVWPANYWEVPTGQSYFSRDNGATWTLSRGLPAKPVVISDRSTADTFYALDGGAKRLLISVDGGATFAPRGAAIPDGFSKLFAAPRSAGDLWMTGSAGLMHSKNGGATWTKIAAVSTSETLGFGKAAPGATADALFLAGKVGQVTGLFRSDDAGQSWVRINDDKHQYGSIGQSITGDPRVFGRVFVATNGRGIVWGEPAPRVLLPR